MAKQYKIRNGFSFVGADRKAIGGGQIVTLEDDVAAGQMHKLEEVLPAAPAKKPTPKAKADLVQTSAQEPAATEDLTETPVDTPAEQPTEQPAGAPAD